MNYKNIVLVAVLLSACSSHSIVVPETERYSPSIKEVDVLYNNSQFNHVIQLCETSDCEKSVGIQKLYAKSLIKTGRYAEFKSHFKNWLTVHPSDEGDAFYQHMIDIFE